MKAFVVAYLFLNLIVLPAKADIIYFKDGMKTICQEKAWEEDGQIKCEYAGWVLTYPKNEILRIVKTNTAKQAATPEKNQRVDQIIKTAISWDVMGGVARRAWARNDNSIETTMNYNELRNGSDHVTLPFIAEDAMVEELVANAFDNLRK